MKAAGRQRLPTLRLMSFLRLVNTVVAAPMAMMRGKSQAGCQ